MKTRIDKLEMQGFKSFAKKTTVLFPSDFAVVCGPNGSGKSTKWDTEVILSDGSIRPIGELVDNALRNCRQKIKMDDGIYTLGNPEGIKTWGLDPKTMKIVEKDISAFIKRKGEPHLFQITTRTGKSVTTTGCHPVMIYRDGKIRSEVINALKTGDVIATPRKLDLPEKKLELNIPNLPPLTPKFARFLGYVVGDGHIKVHRRCKRCEFINADKELIEDFVSISKSLGYKPMLHNYEYRGKATLVCLNSKALVESLITLFNKKYKGKDKHTPKEILFSQKRVLANFLAALFDCDSSIRRDNPTFEYVTKSEKLADQVQLALLRFGIVARKRTKIKYATNTKNKTKRKYYHITIEGKEKLKALYENIPLRCEHKRKRLENWAKRPIVSNPNTDILPEGANALIKECRETLGIEYKPLRKKYPRFAAYNENRCCPTREGIKEALSIFAARVEEMKSFKKSLKKDKKHLLKVMRRLRIKRSDAGIAIGLHHQTINSCWAHGKYGPKPENLEKLFNFLKSQINEKLSKSNEMMKTLQLLANSDIFWDKIVKIKKTSGEKWVYDLTIPNCHNFIGNGIFVHNSNILDAICFVLGRKSAKSLRAGKMMEMIFNGAHKTAPADFAKVSIYLDNSKKVFPLDESQICVSRRVNRKGVSIYKLNNRTVTREKILEVLRTAHIHPDGHNIILQGDITDVIEMSPLERREIIDEISGISEFEEKREKAHKELNTVEERLKESAIVLNERANILQKLEAEKKAAEKYNVLTAELDKLRASLAKRKLSEAENAMSKLEKAIEEKEAEAALADAELVKIDKEIEGLTKRTERVQARLIDRSRDIAVIKDLEAIRSEIFGKKAKIDTNEFEVARIKDMIKKLEALRTQQMEGNVAVQALLKLGRTGVYGTIATLSKVPGKYQTAIEVAAGPHLFDIVTDTAETAIECVNHLKQNRIGRATVLPLDKIRERKGAHLKKFLGKPGVIDIALNLISFNRKYWRAFSFVFGDTLVVDTIETARRLGIGQARFVTLDGDLIERSGAIIGGFYRSERRAFASTADIEKYEADKKKLIAEINSLQKDIKNLTAKLHSLVGEEEKSTKLVYALQKERNELEASLEDARNKRKEFYEHKSAAAEEVNRLKINRARLEAELENLKAEFEQCKADIETYDLAPSTLQGRIRDVMAKIQELGPINQKAVEEFEQLKVEYDKLKTKVDTLTSERNRVLEIIADIEGRRRDTFMRTFEAVNEQFKVIFKELLKGEGMLRLEGDILEESGLIIEASPPGRKVLNIDAMSGGEKAMTALAFLFAIQQFKPAPFYILDEIDAALDRPNTKKMNEFLKLNSKRAQFVVISHNDTTIQAADCVYGVSMEDGESKLVGIRMPN